MEFVFTSEQVEKTAVDVIVVFVEEYDSLTSQLLKSINEATGGTLSTLLKSDDFNGGADDYITLYHPRDFQSPCLIIAGLGGKKDLTPDKFRRAAGVVSRSKAMRSAKTAGFYFGAYDDREYFQAVVEGYLLGSFRLTDYKSDKDRNDKPGPSSLTLIADSRSAVRKMEAAATRGEIIGEGQMIARRLSATPANDLTPKKYATLAKKYADMYGFKLTVLDEKAIRQEKMGGLLGVAQGSAEPPRFLILEYMGGPKNQKPIVLVGKGVTFDSGGISLKPGKDMHEMKQDMTGSAVVLATLATAARLKIARNVVGLIPATENMPSGTATRPGDILTMRNGMTVEVINTDAEGRLILADALDYADKYDPQAVIDIATLTGATLYILGYSGAPITGNNDNLIELLKSASANTGERVWAMPIWDDFRKQMKSSIADLVNSGGRPAGTLAAAAFLENFIGEWPWAHIDIAYMDNETQGRPYVPKGASGFGVRLLVDTLSNWKKV